MCPSCQSEHIRRSRTRKLHDHLMKWAGMCAYRCRDCNRRFYITSFQDAKIRREQKRDSERMADLAAINGNTAPGGMNPSA